MKNKIKYLTHAKVTEVIRKAVKIVYPDIPKKELIKYSCHSLRVWACLILDEAGKSPDSIKNRLRWMGESDRVYIRETNRINELHNEAIQESSLAVMELLEFVDNNNMEQLPG